MPTWWADLLSLAYTLAWPLFIIAILSGIILYSLILPYFGKISNAFHKIFIYSRKIHDADIDHSVPPDEKGNYILHTREKVLNGHNTLLSELKGIHEILDSKMCEAACPAFKSLIESMAAREKHEKDFLSKQLELRKHMTEDFRKMAESNSELHRRIDTFMESSIDKRDELIAKILADKERKNGG